ncbi:hypothetical protein AB6A23_11115 [Paenibacillus tarimensis]
MKPLDEVITALEAVEILAGPGLSKEVIASEKRQIQRLCKRGAIEARQAPGALLILKSSVLEYKKKLAGQ